MEERSKAHEELCLLFPEIISREILGTSCDWKREKFIISEGLLGTGHFYY